MLPKYFQGQSLQAPVHASPARTFSDVVERLRVCPTLGIKRSAFLALGKKERNEKKQVPFFVAACFKRSPSKRVYAEATHCNLLFLDIDLAQDAAPFVRNPDALYAALEGFNFAAYTTASSTAEQPRMRIVVDASNIPVARYRDAVNTIGAMLALSRVTSESQVAVQAMYAPTMFSDSTEENHPLIAFRTNARAFTEADISDETGVYKEQPRTVRSADTSDSLNFLRAPLPEITLGVAKEALGHIDAGLDRKGWLEVAAALKHQFSPHHAEEAYDLFDEWSSTDEKYGGQDDTRKLWDSLRQSPAARLPITIRSLLRQAAAAGWNDQRVKDSCLAQLQEWMDTVETATELLETGVQRIIGMSLMTPLQESRAIEYLRKQAKVRFAEVVRAADIKKDLARVKAEIKALEKPEQIVREPVWAKGVCYVAAAQVFYRQRTGEKYTKESFNNCYSRFLLPSAENLREAGIPVTPASLSRPIVLPADYALNHLKIPTVHDCAYDPSRPTELFFFEQGRNYVNTYSPASIPELDPAGAADAGILFQQHLSNLVAEPEHRRTLVDFMAFMVQNPGRKIRWAAVIQGVEGCGKTFLAEMMKAVLGKEHVNTVGGDSIKSGYNDWSFGHQLVVLEEVRVVGTNRHEIMNALKPLITNDTVSINEKFRSQREVGNISNYMVFSNHQDMLALTAGDRRYFIIKSPLQSKAQVKALGDDYFKTLFGMIKKSPGAMRSYLMDWEISTEFRPDGHAPTTKYVQELINDSASDMTAAVRRLLLEADHPLVQYDIVSAKALNDMLLLEDGIRHGVSAQQLAHVLREEGFTALGRHLLGTERHYLWARGHAAQNGAVATADERVAKGAKNLCMELLF